MCGILAILDTPETDSARRHGRRGDEVLDLLAHRGPDGRDTLMLGNAWLGHRRLAIVDPVGGAQPFNQHGIACVANGEIYNHAELRAALPAASRRELSQSDCAVIGPVWEQQGDALPSLLDGQFAFVAVDDRKRRWIAGRDQAGICPLYVGYHEDGTYWFASEMKALVADCAHVEIVPPGHCFICDGTAVRREAWYRPAWMSDIPDTPLNLNKLRDTLIDSVLERLMTDVPCGLLLSGGVDSSIIAAIAVRYAERARHLRRFSERFHTFAIGLEGAPDLAPARRVAEFLGTIHHEFTFTLDEALAAVPPVVRHLESYQQVRTAVPTYLLAKRVRELGIKMVLSGEGADEIFGGYLYFHRAPDAAEFHRETVRKVTRLHQFDVMRANKAPMGWGLEVRVPFLDKQFLDLAMSIDPREKLIDMHARPDGQHARMEKYLLRKAFHDPSDPWLPEEILWRQKEQFSDGCGYGWVDRLREFSEQRLRPALWENRSVRYPEDAPTTPELFWMRELFEAEFVSGRAAGRSPVWTVGHGRSVACSTPEALVWDPSWATCSGDISGRTMAGVHAAVQEEIVLEGDAAQSEAA